MSGMTGPHSSRIYSLSGFPLRNDLLRLRWRQSVWKVEICVFAVRSHGCRVVRESRVNLRRVETEMPLLARAGDSCLPLLSSRAPEDAYII